MREKNTERNSENRVRCNYTTSWMNFQVHERSLVELMQECVPMPAEIKTKNFYWLAPNYSLRARYVMAIFILKKQQQSACTSLTQD